MKFLQNSASIILNEITKDYKFAEWFKQWRIWICYKKVVCYGQKIAKDKYNQNNSIKFETGNIKSSLCDYSDAFILVIRGITVAANNDTDVAFENHAPFSTCKTEINDMFIDEANHIYIAMPMYNLIEYSHNYSDTSGSLRKFKRDEVTTNNANLSIDNSQSFKYKAALVKKTANADGGNSFVKNTKIVVPLKWDFWKIHFGLNWIEDCILSSDGNSAKFKITDAKLNVPIVTLSNKDNVNLTKQLSDGFKWSLYWNSY